MTFANINIGNSPDDHTGDPLRVAFEKINRNFANITTNGTGVNSVAGRTGNVLLSVNDVLGAVSIGALPSLVAEALGDISVPTTIDMSSAIATALSTAEAYTDASVNALLVDAPDGLQTIKQLADAIGDDPAFYMQVVSLRNGLTLANAVIASNTSNIAGLWANASLQSATLSTLGTSVNTINANVTAANAKIATNTQNISTLQTSDTTHTAQISAINSNVTAANAAISTLQSAGYATTGYVDSRIASVVGAAPAALDTLKELADALDDDASFATHITNTTTAINANVTAANAAIGALQSNTASLASSINTNTTNITNVANGLTTANTSISALQGNTATLASAINGVQSNVNLTNANVTAANAAISALQSADTTITGYINAVNANVASANAIIATHTTQISAIDANVTAANSAIGLVNGTVASLNTTVNAHQNTLTVGPISISGNISGNTITANGRVITTDGIFWSNGTAFVSGSGGAANTGNIIFDGDTIGTINNADSGITFDSAGNGEIHIRDFTGVNNANPGAWFEVGNLTDNINTGNVAINFSNASGFHGSALWSWNWSDGNGNGTFPDRPSFKKFGLYKNGDLNNYWLEIDSTTTTANIVTINNSGVSLARDLRTTGNTYQNNAVIGISALDPNIAPGNIPLYVTNNPEISGPVAAAPDVIARFVGADTGNASLFLEGYSSSPTSGPIFIQRANGGTITGGAAVGANDILGRYVARGRGTTRYSTSSHAGIIMLADSDFTDTNTPSSVSVVVVPPNSTTSRQIARFASNGNTVITSNNTSTSTTTGAFVVQGGVGLAGNIYVGQGAYVTGSLSSANLTVTSSTILRDVTSLSVTESTSPANGALTVAGGAGIAKNLNVGGDLDVTGSAYINGRLTVESSNDIVDGPENEALHVDGGARIYSSLVVGHQLFIGNSSVDSTSQNSVIDAKLSAEFVGGSKYTQIALRADSSMNNGSTDFAAYSDNGSDDAGWVDMGFTSSTFNDPLYTITKPNDGYVITRPVDGYGGNLVIATSEAGTYNDIVFGVGSFDSSAEVARFHGNVATGGTFTVKTDLVVQGNLISQHPGSATISSGNDITLSPAGNIINLAPMVLVKLSRTELITTVANTTGAVAYNTTANAPVYFNGTNWVFFSDNSVI